jgi:hypothetical protein
LGGRRTALELTLAIRATSLNPSRRIQPSQALAIRSFQRAKAIDV